MAARMKDIARDLGVSLMTVSKALRNHSDISEQTRKRVLKHARQLGYQPNWIARSLATRRTYVVGLVIPDLMHSFFAEVAKGVARKFEPLGYQIVISNSEEKAEVEERQIELLLARSVDGLIVASAQANGRSGLFQTLRARKVPFVLIDRLPAGLGAHYVGVNDEEIGVLATEHLIEQGCRRIAHIRGPAISTGIGRLRGYRRAQAKHGLKAPPEYVVSGRHDDPSGYEAMRDLLRLNPRPDGVFCYNDPVAAGAIKAVLEAGLNVPHDLAIIGAGNVHYSDLLRVPLSTVDQSSSLIGETAADLLAQCMEAKTQPTPKRIWIPPRLVVRESSRRI
ncbi:MAG: LacI family DNA-binding transcriptional regulator [Acidobacteria bacterium]|nr:LacI family DNA-binding transcriptional regulator [Acidobacteriota bacterium]